MRCKHQRVAILLNPVYGVLAAMLVLGLVLIRAGGRPRHAPPVERMAAAGPENAAPLTMTEVMSTLNELAVRRDRGEITQGDFDGQKVALLARL